MGIIKKRRKLHQSFSNTTTSLWLEKRRQEEEKARAKALPNKMEKRRRK